MKNKTTVKKYIGAGIKFLAATVVFIFLGLRSLDFFTFTTPAEQWYLAYLGWGLTGGGVIAYLLVFLWDADTELKKTIAIIMLGVCVIGELVTAGFGLKIDAWKNSGYQMTASDFQAMVLAVQLLGFAHAAALIGYIAGDPIAKAFSDDDGDGIPNILDKDNSKKPAGFTVNKSETDLLVLSLQKQIDELKASQKENPSKGGN